MKKFKATPSRGEITEVGIVRETASSVYFASEFYRDGIRTMKMSDHCAYFDTWQEAQAHSIAHIERGIATLLRQLDREQEKLQKIREMQQP